MIYGDSSLLVALYRRGDAFHGVATKLVLWLKKPLPITLLAELELLNGLGRCLAGGLLDQVEHDAIIRQIEADEADGILVRPQLAESDIYAQARSLSRKYTPEISARSLDILHVASAIVLEATPFLSFDSKQRVLAQKVGLQLLPRVLSSK
jgi:predicted nucleic acid-binding protein